MTGQPANCFSQACACGCRASRESLSGLMAISQQQHTLPFFSVVLSAGLPCKCSTDQWRVWQRCRASWARSFYVRLIGVQLVCQGGAQRCTIPLTRPSITSRSSSAWQILKEEVEKGRGWSLTLIVPLLDTRKSVAVRVLTGCLNSWNDSGGQKNEEAWWETCFYWHLWCKERWNIWTILRCS